MPTQSRGKFSQRKRRESALLLRSAHLEYLASFPENELIKNKRRIIISEIKTLKAKLGIS